jgi:methionyl aminopeptidase
MIASEIKEGVTTLYLDKLAEEFIRDHGAEPVSWLMVPNSLCMSPNAQVVHGIPNNTLESGDVISVDCGAYKMDTMVIMPIL